ncbi:hypothetical protein AB4342_19610, partial [Vibrio breoganii]
MNEYISLAGYSFDKSLVIAVVVFFLLLTVALVIIQNNLEAQRPTQLSFSNKPVSKAYVDVNDYCDTQEEDVLQLAFCPNDSAVINAETKEVIAKFNAGSQNYRLLAYL